jgi:hypothetical protein
MACLQSVVEQGRKRGLLLFAAFGLLLCASAIAPLGGWSAWLHAHDAFGWHLHVDHGSVQAGHAHPHGARSEARRGQSRETRVDTSDGVHVHDHAHDAHGRQGDHARSVGHAGHDDHAGHGDHGARAEPAESGDHGQAPCGLAISLPELLIASGRMQGFVDGAGSPAPSPPRGVPFAAQARNQMAARLRPAARGSPPRQRRRSGIALVVQRNHAILV